MTAIRLFCSDLDGTLLGNSDSTRRFLEAWESLPKERRPVLAFSSGRSVTDMQLLIERRVLPSADYLIGSVGTEIHNVREGRMEQAFSDRFAATWNPILVRKILGATLCAEPQPAAFSNAFKSSWFLRHAEPEALAELRTRLDDAGLEVSVIYSNGLHLDVIPRRAGKGRSLAWLCGSLGIPFEGTLVAGDSGNDWDMFLLPGVRRLIVGNAQPELLRAAAGSFAFVARAAMADGVLEGLDHFGVIERPPG